MWLPLWQMGNLLVILQVFYSDRHCCFITFIYNSSMAYHNNSCYAVSHCQILDIWRLLVTVMPSVTWVTSPGTVTSNYWSIEGQCDVTRVTNDIIVTFITFLIVTDWPRIIPLWLLWQHSGYHGNINPWQQFSSQQRLLLIKVHSLLGTLWVLRRISGCHGNGCQGNQVT